MPGWLSQLNIRLLISAQVMISQLHEFEPHIGPCTDHAEPAWDSLSLSVSLKRNKLKKKLKMHISYDPADLSHVAQET